MPIALKRVTPCGGRLVPPATISDRGVAARPASSLARRPAASGLSATTRSHRSTRAAVSSARSGVIAPTAFTSVPVRTDAASRNGVRARVRRRDHVRLSRRLGDRARVLDSERPTAAPRLFHEGTPMLRVRAVDEHPVEGAHGAHRRELGHRLLAGADERSGPRVVRCQPSGGDAGHRARAELPEREGLDDRPQRAFVRVPEHDERRRSTVGVCPRLRRDDAFVLVDSADRVERVPTSPRDMRLLHRVRRRLAPRAQRFFDSVDRVDEVDCFDDIGLGEPERDQPSMSTPCARRYRIVADSSSCGHATSSASHAARAWCRNAEATAR